MRAQTRTDDELLTCLGIGAGMGCISAAGLLSDPSLVFIGWFFLIITAVLAMRTD